MPVAFTKSFQTCSEELRLNSLSCAASFFSLFISLYSEQSCLFFGSPKVFAIWPILPLVLLTWGCFVSFCFESSTCIGNIGIRQSMFFIWDLGLKFTLLFDCGLTHVLGSFCLISCSISVSVLFWLSWALSVLLLKTLNLTHLSCLYPDAHLLLRLGLYYINVACFIFDFILKFWWVDCKSIFCPVFLVCIKYSVVITESNEQKLCSFASKCFFPKWSRLFEWNTRPRNSVSTRISDVWK